MTDNADLLTNACMLLDRYRAELPALEARVDFLREAIAALTAGTRTRRGRPPKLVEETPLEMPLRVAGGVSEPEVAA
jgi:hypothetical protein